MHVFGLTGGIASGKSTVARRIKERGIPVVDADAIAREVVMRGTPGLGQLVAAFGEDVLAADGELDRKKLGALVFADAELRKKLNGIIHPLISARSAELIQSHGAAGHPLACYEAALLVENGLADVFRPLVVVAATPDVQLERIVKRDGLDRAAALARIEAQLPLAEKVAMADYVIESGGPIPELYLRVDGVLDAILASHET